MKKASIKTQHLKDFLSLFDKETVLDNLGLGDTWHPSSGYVDESILKGKNKIKDILDFDYNFNGLVAFEADMQDVNVIYKNELFLITAPQSKLRSIESKVIELNAYTPEKYQFSYIAHAI